MAKPGAITLDQPLSSLTVGELRQLIADVVRQVIREELYYVNEEGFKVLVEEEDIAPEYLAQLQEDYEKIVKGEMELVEGEKVLQELRELGVNL